MPHTFFKNSLGFLNFFRERAGASFATGAALFVGMTQIWLLYNQNQLIEQQNEFIELQGYSSRVQAVQLILEGYKNSSDADLTIAQLESLGDEGFNVLLYLSTSESPLNNLAMESLVKSDIATSNSDKVEVYIALAETFAEKAKYYPVTEAAQAYLYLDLLDRYLKKTELKKGQSIQVAPNLLSRAKDATREIGIVAVGFRAMEKPAQEEFAKAIAQSPGFKSSYSFDDKDSSTWALIFYSEQLISVMARIGSWCHLDKEGYLPELLIENYRMAYKHRVEDPRSDLIVTHRDPWLFNETCEKMEIFGFHEDSIEYLTKQQAENTIYLDDKVQR